MSCRVQLFECTESASAWCIGISFGWALPLAIVMHDSTQGDSLVPPLQCLFWCCYWLRAIALQGHSSLPRRSSSFTTARSPDSRTAMPNAFSTDPYSASPRGRAAHTSSSSKGTPVSSGSAAKGSFGRQHGSSSSLDTTAGVQGSPSTSASPLSGLSKAQRTPPIPSRYPIVHFNCSFQHGSMQARWSSALCLLQATKLSRADRDAMCQCTFLAPELSMSVKTAQGTVHPQLVLSTSRPSLCALS